VNNPAVSSLDPAKKSKGFIEGSEKYSQNNAIVLSPQEGLYRESTLQSGILGGRAVAVKDNIAVKGWRITCASGILHKYESPYHATAVEKILAHGGVIVGKTNHDEFAMGSSTEHSRFGPARHPTDKERVPGGSSGGSALSVALGLTDLALGSDTGGSVRQPAAFCGVYGLKPTYGRVSRYGLVAFASSFDQIGPFGKTTGDIALLLETVAGVDEKDATSSAEPVPPYSQLLEGDLPQRIGVPWNFLAEGVDEEILERLKSLLSSLERAGCKIETVILPHCKFAIATYYVLTMAEASSNLARFDGVRFGLSERDETLEEMYCNTRSAGFGDEVKRRIMLGTYILSSGYYDAYYCKAQKVRRLIRDDFVDAFSQVDVIILPTTPTPPFKLGENLDNPLEMYLADIFTTPMSLAGVPAISIPCAEHSAGLPIGLQLVGDFFCEETILRLSHYIEQNSII
jgi:aspartyl-tRNA(Asn)/glutamyl-tRNA(Gln) amidotransferase subunit A|tara:strand:+ start:23188 stop:24558 length:1371 start_codon:yes stop_codon:yes gene_type:complete